MPAIIWKSPDNGIEYKETILGEFASWDNRQLRCPEGIVRWEVKTLTHPLTVISPPPLGPSLAGRGR